MFKNMKVGTRLIAGFLFVSLMGAIVAGIGIANMGKISDNADRMYANELLGLSYIKEANIGLVYVGRARANFLLSTSEEERESNKSNIKKYLADIKENLEKAKPLFMTARAQELFADYAKISIDYEQTMEKALTLAAATALQERSVELNQALADTRKYANILDNNLTELSKQKEARAKTASEEAAALYRSSRSFMLLLVLSSVLMGMALGVLITRNLTRQLGGEPQYAAEIAGKIAAGDLTVAVVTKAKDHSSLLFAMKRMRDSLAQVVGQVRSGTDTIATASSQIAAGNQDLSSRTEQQASSLEETASSMEELTSTVKQNADNARQANQLAV
ncbi:MAG: MCP four helix bundle domain-containing protein, partial [Burkholderiaceae bacterium]